MRLVAACGCIQTKETHQQRSLEREFGVTEAGEEGVRFLLVSGQPIEEPVAWRGPIVMNTTEQLQQAYSELRAGTFIK